MNSGYLATKCMCLASLKRKEKEEEENGKLQWKQWLMYSNILRYFSIVVQNEEAVFKQSVAKHMFYYTSGSFLYDQCKLALEIQVALNMCSTHHYNVIRNNSKGILPVLNMGGTVGKKNWCKKTPAAFIRFRTTVNFYLTDYTTFLFPFEKMLTRKTNWFKASCVIYEEL